MDMQSMGATARRESPDGIRGRIFVVGCPRSGTTLLQAMLAAHPDTYTFPESHFFRKVWGRLWNLRVLGLVPPRAAARAINLLLAEVQWSHARPQGTQYWPFARPYERAFLEIVDRACLDARKSVWVEKSPIHLHCLSQILKIVPDARFVHVLRDGREVVASLFGLCRSDGERWIPQLLPKRRRKGARDFSDAELLEAAARRWNTDIAISLVCRGRPAHLIVRYDQLVRAPEPTLRRVCSYLSLPFSDTMLRHSEVASDVVGWRGRFDHMKRVLSPVSIAAESKFGRLTTSQREIVLSRLKGGGDLDRCLGNRAPEVTNIDNESTP